VKPLENATFSIESSPSNSSERARISRIRTTNLWSDTFITDVNRLSA